MIEKIYKLGKLIPEKWIELDPYNLELGEYDKKIIVLNFVSKKRNKIVLEGSTVKDYAKADNLRYWFYKRVMGRGYPEFPTMMITAKDISYKKSGIPSNSRYMKKLLYILEKCTEANDNLLPLLTFFRTKAGEIQQEIEWRIKKIADFAFVTITLDGYSIGESPLFEPVRKRAMKNRNAKYYILNKKKVVVNDKFCSVCLQEKEEIWGYVSLLGVYAAKTDFSSIAGGFKKEDAWKNYPVCPQCAEIMEIGRNFILSYSNKTFCGMNYFLIPEFIFPEMSSATETLQVLEGLYDPEGKLAEIKAREGRIYFLTDMTYDNYYYLSSFSNNVSYSLYFYERERNKFSILEAIENIPPSHLKTIFAAKADTESAKIFKQVNWQYKNDEGAGLKFRLDYFCLFFPFKSRVEGNYGMEIVDVLGRVFNNQPLDYNVLLSRIISAIRCRYQRDREDPLSFRIVVMKAMLLLRFLRKMELLTDQSYTNYKEIKMDNTYYQFFNEHQDFFDNNAKRAVFLEGVMAQSIIDTQLARTNAKPFRKRLFNLKLNSQLVRGLLPEMIDLLERYHKGNSYRELKEYVAMLLLNSNLEEVSSDDLSFYFAMGMALNRQFKAKRGDKNEPEES